MCVICLCAYLCKEKRLEGSAPKCSRQSSLGVVCGVIPVFFFVLFWIFPKIVSMSIYHFGTGDKQ